MTGKWHGLTKRVSAWLSGREGRTGEFSAYVPVKERVALLAFALVTGALMTGLLHQGASLPWATALLFGAIAAGCTALTNWIVSSSLVQSRTAAVLVPVLASSLVFGAILAVVLIPFLFEADVVELRYARIPDLEAEVARLSATVKNPPRGEVDKDPAVAPRLADYLAAQNALEEAEKAYTEELDGTGGSRTQGIGPASNGKKDTVDRRAKERDRASDELATARKDAKDRIDGAAKAAADDAQTRLDDRLEELNPLRDERGEVRAGRMVLDLPTHLRAVPQIVSHRPVQVPATFIGIILAYGLLHVIPLYFPRNIALERRRERKRVENEQRRYRRPRSA